MQQSPIVSILHVRNNFIKQRVTVKSRDCVFALFRGQTSNEYNNTGIHLLFSRCRKTSSEANLPILLNNAFTDRKKDCFALSNEHLNLQNRTIAIPKYLILSTHIMGVPSPLKISAHLTLYRWPMRMQPDFLTLICISKKFSSRSHILTMFCSSEVFIWF